MRANCPVVLETLQVLAFSSPAQMFWLLENGFPPESLLPKGLLLSLVYGWSGLAKIGRWKALEFHHRQA
jgi:hypothetical protein